MFIMMSEQRVKQMAKRLRKVLQLLGIESRHTECLELAVRLCGFHGWRHYLDRDLDEPLGLLDDAGLREEFTPPDKFQMAAMEAAGLGPVARELLDRVNPTGFWTKQSTEGSVVEAIRGNAPH